MSYKNKKIISFCILVIFCFFVLAPSVIAADYGLTETLKATDKEGNALSTKLKDNDIPTIIGTLVGALLAFIGIIFFVLIIYGGITWMTASGNEEQVNKAITMMKQAVFGLIVVSAAYLITKFVGETIINAF